MVQTKDLRLVEAGRKGAAARWGPPIRVRLDDFSADERAAIVAAIDAKRAARAAMQKAVAEDQTPATAGAEGQANDRTAA